MEQVLGHLTPHNTGSGAVIAIVSMSVRNSSYVMNGKGH